MVGEFAGVRRVFAARLGFRGSFVAAALAVAGLVAVPPARAEVVGTGDIEPFVDDNGVLVPDLPITGGIVGDDIIVGGTDNDPPIGGTHTGSLRIDAPAFTDPLVSNSGVIGGITVGIGIVNIVGAGSQWRIIDGPEGFVVGQNGQGTLNLTSGGQLVDEFPNNQFNQIDLEVTIAQHLGSQGSVSVSGTGSLLQSDVLNVGQGGFGLVTLTNAAQINTMSTAIIGDVDEDDPDGIGNGYVEVTGSSTRWLVGGLDEDADQTGNLIVGNNGTGFLLITTRAEVLVTDNDLGAGDITIGGEADGIGEVTVQDQFTRMRAFGTLTISDNGGRGVLNIRNGAEVYARVGVDIGDNGVLELQGGRLITPGQVTNAGVIRTAVGAVGQVDSVVENVANGEIRTAGTVERIREKLLFNRQVFNRNDGLVTSIGGELEFTQLVTNDLGGTIAGRDAVYRFRGGLLNNGTLGFSVGVSDVFGEISNGTTGVIGIANKTDVTFYDDVDLAAGELSVLPGGNAIFMQDINLSASSVLTIHLNEIASVVQIGKIDVFGDIALAGALNIRAGTGLDPQPGDSFEIISASSVTGTFTSVLFPPAAGNNWSITYTPESVLINFISAPAFNADFNGDNVVNAADLAIWRMNVGAMPVTQMDGDADGDGDVDGSDFLIWQRTQGPVPPGVPATGAVPEPGAAALALMALVGGALRRRRVTTG
jgi:T5SS/PEP-CTERM-associated repeat protein